MTGVVERAEDWASRSDGQRGERGVGDDALQLGPERRTPTEQRGTIHEMAPAELTTTAVSPSPKSSVTDVKPPITRRPNTVKGSS